MLLLLLSKDLLFYEMTLQILDIILIILIILVVIVPSAAPLVRIAG